MTQLLEKALAKVRDLPPAEQDFIARIIFDQTHHVETPEDEDLMRWSRDVDELAAAIAPEDFDRVDRALEQAKREAKEYVRQQMRLS